MRFTALRGTLIAAAPTRDGVVPAADSRSTIGDRHCDDTYKLVEVTHTHPTELVALAWADIFAS
jgi:hypothetical protein